MCFFDVYLITDTVAGNYCSVSGYWSISVSSAFFWYGSKHYFWIIIYTISRGKFGAYVCWIFNWLFWEWIMSVQDNLFIVFLKMLYVSAGHFIEITWTFKFPFLLTYSHTHAHIQKKGRYYPYLFGSIFYGFIWFWIWWDYDFFFFFCFFMLFVMIWIIFYCFPHGGTSFKFYSC